MLDSENQTLKDILLNANACSAQNMKEAEEEFERTGKPLQQILIDFQILTENEILNYIAESLGTTVVDLSMLEVPKEVIDLIDADNVRMLGVVPIDADDTAVTLAVRNPLNYQIADEMRFVLGKDVLIVLAEEKQIDSFIDKYYPIDINGVNDLLSEMDAMEGSDYAYANAEEDANKAPIIKFVDAVLYQAIRDKASDIHFEPFEHEFKIRYRIDGALYEMSPPPRSLAIPVISRVKILSGLNISERRKPQDGRIQLKIAGRPIDLRVSTLPTSHGESVVLRVLDRSVVNLDLDVLGINEETLKKIREIIAMPNGIFIITGPTGSGKTTTLYSALKEINKVEDKILTAEDPVEYDLEGIVQLPINDAIGMTFGRALRAFLRQDPDIIMLGETRDIETAEMAVQASLTGHLVFTTLHTNDAAGAVMRFVDMNVAPYMVASTLEAVLGQRLLRTCCKECKTSYEPDDETLDRINLTRDQIGGRPFYFGKGCKTCNGTGYKGRKGVFEYLRMSPPLRELVNNKAPTLIIREKARELGMRTMREHGVQAILDGYTTVDEVLRYT